MAPINLEYLHNLLRTFSALIRQPSQKQLTLSAAGLAALTIVLRYAFSKERKLISNLHRIGKPVNSQEAGDEYDFIIIGGGAFLGSAASA